MKSLVISRPDDWHLHLRDGDYLKDTTQATARHFGRALVMPNLKPALTSLNDLLAYRERILAVLPSESTFEPLMTFYLNDKVALGDLIKAKAYAYIMGAKLYPAGATTNASEGVAIIKTLYPLFALMQELDLVLQIHGEENQGDIFDRESLFIERVLIPLMKDFPKLRIVLEHISTQKAVDFILQAPARLAATVTPHHLLYNRNHILSGGIRPHFYCLPILKREEDQKAILQAVLSGSPKFFAGTDSAPHPKHLKENNCGCAGIYSSPFALGLYAEIFDQNAAILRLEAFVSHFGADFYQLPRQKADLELLKKEHKIPEQLPFGTDFVVPIAANQILTWSVNDR